MIFRYERNDFKITEQNNTISVILGSGFSYVTGLPLAKDLLNSAAFIASKRSEGRFNRVWKEWERWQGEHPGQASEQFLSAVYHGEIENVPWTWAVELVSATLACPLKQDRPAWRNWRYAGRITRPVGIPVHDAFWDIIIKKYNLLAVVTANYDILAERGLRYRPMKRPHRPGFVYGGIAFPQILKGLALPFTVLDPKRIVELKNGIPLFKLHGSLNWAQEKGQLVMYQDLRPAFRYGSDALIVPPVLEKEMPAWLLNVWESAIMYLSRSEIWLVCGYSLPVYDIALRDMFQKAAKKGQPFTIMLIDPAAQGLAFTWQQIAPHAKIICLPGLPDALDMI
jgi:hypothetical protein